MRSSASIDKRTSSRETGEMDRVSLAPFQDRVFLGISYLFVHVSIYLIGF
jgi:hypothetical protein